MFPPDTITPERGVKATQNTRSDHGDPRHPHPCPLPQAGEGLTDTTSQHRSSQSPLPGGEGLDVTALHDQPSRCPLPWGEGQGEGSTALRIAVTTPSRLVSTSVFQKRKTRKPWASR